MARHRSRNPERDARRESAPRTKLAVRAGRPARAAQHSAKAPETKPGYAASPGVTQKVSAALSELPCVVCRKPVRLTRSRIIEVTREDIPVLCMRCRAYSRFVNLEGIS